MSFLETLYNEIKLFEQEMIERCQPKTYTPSKIKELKDFLEQTNCVMQPEKYIALHIKGQENFKRLCALTSITPFKPIHVLCVGDPATGKTEIAYAFEKITPNFVFRASTKVTKAGLTVSQVGGHLSIGALPKAHTGVLVIDEFNLMRSTEASAVLMAMSQHWYPIEQAFLKIDKVLANLSIIGMANPLGDYFMSSNPFQIARQMPFKSKALLTRFHLIFTIFSPSLKEFKEIVGHQLRFKNETITIGFDKHEQKLWSTLIEWLRFQKVEWGEDELILNRMIENFVSECYNQFKKRRVTIPVTPRLSEGITNLSEAIAKARLHETVEKSDVIEAIKLVGNSLVAIGLNLEKALHEARKGYYA